MPGKSNTYTLGELGVNRVLSPVHLTDGELLVAQNADVPFDKGNRGLRKRSGMVKHNEFPAAGAVLSMTNIPIPDPLPTTEDPPPPLPPADPPGVNAGDIYLLAAGSTWQVSTDGVTFTGSSTPAVGVALNVNGNSAMVSHRGRIYQTNGAVVTSFDAAGVIVTHGTLSGILTRPYLFCDWPNDLIFGIPVAGLGTMDDTAFRYNVATETFDELPTSYVTAGCVLALAVGALNGVPYVSDSFGLGGVYTHNGSAWVSDGNPDPGGDVLSFVRGPFDGELYAATGTRVARRAGPSSWTDVYVPGTAFGSATMCTAPDAPDGAIYLADNLRRVHRSDDGVIWTLDADLTGSIPRIDALMPWNDVLFAFNFQTSGVQAMSRSSGGVWSEVTDLTFADIGGAIGYV